MRLSKEQYNKLTEQNNVPARYIELSKATDNIETIFNRLKRTAYYQIQQKGLQAEVYCCISENKHRSPYEYIATGKRKRKVFAKGTETDKHIHYYISGTDRQRLLDILVKNEKKHSNYIKQYSSNCIPIAYMREQTKRFYHIQ